MRVYGRRRRGIGRRALPIPVAIVVVAICNTNRANLGTLAGVPWVIPIVLGVLVAWTILLQRTTFGR